MAFPHRKLLNASFSDPSIGNTCGPYCDIPRTTTEPCPAECLAVCYDTCISNSPKIVIVPPPLPSPEIDIPVHDQPRQKHHKLPLFLPIVLAILTTCFFIFACYTAYKFYICWSASRRRRRGNRPEDGEPGLDEFLDEDHGPVVDHPIWYIRTVGLQPSVISAITIVRYKRGDGLIEGTDCSVCLSEFQEDETVRLLPKCNHAFHIPCIDTWLRSHTNCPLCRAGIVNNTAATGLHQPEQFDHSPGSGLSPNSEIRAEASELGVEIRRETGSEEIEGRIALEEDDGDSGPEARLSVNENLGKEEGGGWDEMSQQMRRSVSVDSVSATMISAAVANASDGKQSSVANNEGLLRLVGSLSAERSMQIGTSSVKRSLSCSAKVFLSRYNNNSRSQNSAFHQ